MRIIRTGTRVVLTLIALANLMPDRVASAQSVGRFEVGGQVAALRIQEVGATPAGFGGRVSYDLLDWLSVESEFNHFPHEVLRFDGPGQLVYHRRRSEALFGPKVGLRTERFGMFAKVRPGFAHISTQSIDCENHCAAVTLIAGLPVARTLFAVDLGGVLEFYPSGRTVARVDVGDTIIRQGALLCANCTSHNVASRVGIGLRF